MKGFTLIELSVALSIMAILAAVMLPRIAQLQRLARVGNLQGLRGSVTATATMAHAAMLARAGQRDSMACRGGGTADNQIAGDGTLCTQGGLVRMREGYPTSGVLGIVSAAGLGSVPIPTTTQLNAEGYRVSVSGNLTTFARADADQPEQCSFTYTQALDAKTAAFTSVPVVSGC